MPLFKGTVTGTGTGTGSSGGVGSAFSAAAGSSSGGILLIAEAVREIGLTTGLKLVVLGERVSAGAGTGADAGVAVRDTEGRRLLGLERSVHIDGRRLLILMGS